MIKKYNQRQTDEFEDALLDIRRVTKVTKGGKNLRFRVAMVIGDRKGKVGFGVAKATEVPKAIDKARLKAKKNLIEIPLSEGTIPFEIEIKFKGAQLFLKPASLGTGLIVGRPIRPLIELAGIENILSKIKGSRNKIINAWAVIEAFKKLQVFSQSQLVRTKIVSKRKKVEK